MFELIGLAFDTLILFTLAVVAGCVFTFMAWLIVRQRDCRRWRWMAGALSLPIASAAYLWLCIALLPGESLFGDFSENLPNGYVLAGLGKMPDFSYLEKEGKPYWNQPTPNCIERLQVTGSLIIGQYGQRCRTTEPNAQSEDEFFIFDTKSGSLRNFKLYLKPRMFWAGQRILSTVNLSIAVNHPLFVSGRSTRSPS